MSRYIERLDAVGRSDVEHYLKARHDILEEAIENEQPRTSLRFECLDRWNNLLARALLSYGSGSLGIALSEEGEWLGRSVVDVLDNMDCPDEAKSKFISRFRSYCMEQKSQLKKLEQKCLDMEDSDVFLDPPYFEDEGYSSRVHRLVMEHDPDYRTTFEKLSSDHMRQFVDAELMPLLKA